MTHYVNALGNGRMHVRLPFVESEMGYGMLLSMGHHCEVLAPAHIREELIRRIDAMTQRYAKQAEIPPHIEP